MRTPPLSWPLGLLPFVFLWLHLEVGGENVLTLRNQLPKIVSIAFNSHLNAIPLDVLRPAYDLDASPYGRDARILQPNLELGG
jgi:hypothetical protein